MWFLFGLLWAQEPDSVENPPEKEEEIIESKAELPTVIRASKVNYPESALDEGFGGEVLLELFIDNQGNVLSSMILESLREDMDIAAQEALSRYQFSPAKNELGEAVASSIVYRFVFSPQSVPAISLEGFILEAGTRKSLSSIEVAVVHSSGEKKTITTDEQGRFRFRDLTDGAWTVMAQGPSLAAKTANVTVQDGSIAQVKLYLIRDQALSALQDMEIVIEERAESAEVTERFLKAEDISYLPGSGGDVVKAIQK